VILQHLIAGGADLGTVLLQTRQNDEIALVDHRTAEALHVARTSPLLFRRAAHALSGGGSGKRKRRQGDREEKFTHRVPSF